MIIYTAAASAFVLASAALAQPAPSLSKTAERLNTRSVMVQKLDAQALTPGMPGMLNLFVDDQIRTVILQPRTVRSAWLTHLDTSGGKQPLPEARTWQGVIEDLPGSSIALSGVGEAGSMQFEGMIDLGRDEAGHHRGFVAIQPADDSGEAWPADHHAMYDVTDVLSSGFVCQGGVQVPEDQQPPHVFTTNRGTVPNCIREAQIAIDVDNSYYVLTGNTNASATADVESVINALNIIYARETQVRWVISNLTLRDTASTTLYNTSNINTLLDQLRDEWNTNQAGIVRDAAHLFTGQPTGGTIGLAYVNAMCGSFAYGVSQARFSTNFNGRVGVVAHELGHNMSANHCDGDSDCFIMCSGIGGCSNSVTRFGTRETNAIRGRSQTLSCLTSSAPFATAVAPKAQNDTFAASAGQTIDMDVLFNDFDGNCQTVVINTFQTNPAVGGTVSRVVGVGPNGRDILRYASPAGFVGSATFTYTASDGVSNTTATVRVNSSTPRPADNPASTVSGLDVDYYAITNLSVLPNFANFTPYASDVAGLVDFASTGGNFMNSGRADDVAVVFEGYVFAPFTGLYTFFTESDDGSRLLIGNTVVVNNDGLHGMVEQSGTINLANGLHRMRIEFFERGGGAGLIARWSGPFAKQVIGSGNLFRDNPIVQCGLADVGVAGGAEGFDGILDNNDFIVFINWFFAGDDRADVGAEGGAVGTDGTLDNNDFIVFIDRFFGGC
jgi:hypothetical protein